MSGITIPSTSSNPNMGIEMMAGFGIGGILGAMLGLLLAATGHHGIALGVGAGAWACGCVLGPLIPCVVAKVRESLDEPKKHTPYTDAEELQTEL
jgi:hypothetical protein